jgi:hypothetical protein
MYRNRLRLPKVKEHAPPSTQKIRCPRAQVQRFEETINYYMFSKLKFRRRANLICQFQVEISMQVHNYLEKKFKLTRKFQQREQMIVEFNIVNQRKISDYTTTQIDRSFFLAKLHKKKDVFNNQTKIKGLCFLKLKFRKEEIITQ